VGIAKTMQVALRSTKWRHRHPTEREAVQAWLAEVTAALDREEAQMMRARANTRFSGQGRARAQRATQRRP
jgi:hypothetical protein